MTLFELGAIGEFVGSVAVLITLVYLALQVRQNNRQQRHDRLVAVQHGQNSVVAQMQDSSVVRALAVTAEGDGRESIEDRSKALIWLIQYINHFQIVLEAYQNGEMEREQYDLWEGFVVSMVACRGIRQWWDGENGRSAFMPQTRELIESRLHDSNNPPQPFNRMWSIFSAKYWN
jgi:hypothetical protein